MAALPFLLTRRARVLVLGLCAAVLAVAIWVQGSVGLALECLVLTVLLLAALREALVRNGRSHMPEETPELLAAAMEQSPEQSMPKGDLPPQRYGVPK